MINGLKLHNFQSHEDSVLAFDPGVNVIVGASDNGKSAVIRGLLWAMTNSPSGGGFVSHWAKNDKGNQNKPCSATVTKGNRILTREREKTSNKYIIDESEFGAIGKNVPEQVEEFFDISDVNIQGQHDRPFLLFETSGEVARTLNRVVKLDVIDRAVSGIDSKKRANKKMLDVQESKQIELEGALEKYAHLDSFEELLLQYEKLEEERAQKRIEAETLRTVIMDIETTEDQIVILSPRRVSRAMNLINNRITLEQEQSTVRGTYDALIALTGSIRRNARVLDSVDSVDIISRKIAEIQMKRNELFQDKEYVLELHGIVNRLRESETVVADSENVKSASKIIGKLEVLKFDQGIIDKDYTGLTGVLSDYSILFNQIKWAEDDLADLKLKFPETCPVCGSTLEGDKCAQ